VEKNEDATVIRPPEGNPTDVGKYTALGHEFLTVVVNLKLGYVRVCRTAVSIPKLAESQSQS
jgi:hypothetical protein